MLDSLYVTLPMLAKGMVGVFAVIGILVLATMAMNHFGK